MITVGLPALLENRIRTILSPGTLKLDEASQTFLFIIITLLRHLFAGFEHAKVWIQFSRLIESDVAHVENKTDYLQSHDSHLF